MDHYPFQLKPLPYPYDALEPFIDGRTVRIHHDKHLKTYVDNLNKALSNYPAYQKYSLEYLLRNSHTLPPEIQTAVHNNAGGVYNHNLYFDLLKKTGNKKPSGSLGNAIEKEFGSFNNFKNEFSKAAQRVFGSGYAWLVADKNGKLKIITTANQDTPLAHDLFPVLLIDIWEHAYYLLYQNRRTDYIENWWNIVNWEEAENNYSRYTRRS